LWDSYFLSSGTASQKESLLKGGRSVNPLPNGRVKLNKMAGPTTKEDITDFNRAASRLLIDGAFNVNSTSIEAWESLLLSSIGKHNGNSVAFPRILDLEDGDWDGKNASGGQAWSGQRVFDRSEIRKLAEQIVEQVKERGPFFGLSDFVNRRLSDGDAGKMGALQDAINRAGLNSAFTRTWPLDNSNSLPDFDHKDHIADPTRIEQTLKPDTTAWGALGYLTQADLLQFIGPALSGRSDTFRIRAYGESRDVAGKVEARAWCEAVIQRTPFYVDGSDDMMKRPAELSKLNKEFGRRFEMVSFRWLKREEI
ncbi:MAG TPA: hypothetical protein VM511_04545, partial [Luteolibacter sp.]|nr:hypothetical protein [Luteolibacter sp.]